MDNPYLSTSPLNETMDPFHFQQIHYGATRAAARGVHQDSLPPGLEAADLRARARQLGLPSYILEREQVESIFAGVTPAVYQSVETLYCSREGRSVSMVWRLLKALAEAAQVPAVGYEAVWAICLYLEDRRRAVGEMDVELTDETWSVSKFVPDVRIADGTGSFTPEILCVMDQATRRVIAFRIARPAEECEQLSLVLYEAIAAGRQPNRASTAGLIWRMPATINADVELSAECKRACDALGIQISSTKAQPALPVEIRNQWWQDRAGSVYLPEHLAQIFDTYLARCFGYGPLREAAERRRALNRAVGYSTDPAALLPQLRNFLPLRAAAIGNDDAVEYDGMHYVHQLLRYFPDHEVGIRISPTSEAISWVYLDGDVLCQAMAQELRRKDGTYRPNRPRR